MVFTTKRAAAAVACLFSVALVLAGSGDPAGASPAPSRPAPVTHGAAAATASGTWRADRSGTRQRLYAVACLSASRCEAVGAAGTIVATADGGRTWRPQASGSTKIIYRIACAAPSSCYAIARPDTILVTHNAGATWSRHVLPVGSGPNLTDQACLAATAFAIRGRPALCRLGLLDIACASARVCYAVAATPPSYATTPEPSRAKAPSSVWMTRDGGATWARRPIPAGVTCDGDCVTGRYGYPLEWVSCASSGLCRAGGGTFLGCGHCGFAYAVLATAGPGRPWTVRTTTFSPDAGACPASARCYGVYSTSPFDPGSNVYRSADGGAAWQGGPSGSSAIRNDIACPAARTCYTAGNHGTITRTVNGSSFAAERSPVTKDLYGITCPGLTACYAAGDGGTILARR